MKKLSYLVLSLIFVLSCGLFSACNPNGDGASITLSTSNVSIYLGETENNSVVVNALPNNVDARVLDIVYDTTYIKITQSEKLSDGSFNLTVTSKVADFGTTTPIAVEIKAGTASAVFYVELVLPVEEIVVNGTPHVAYTGNQTTFNLLNCISFEPEGTKQTGVEFILDDEVSYAHIDGNILTIDSGASLNFLTGQIPSLKIKANSTVEGKNSIGAEFNVQIIPNIKLLADVIDVTVDYNGAENVALENSDYNLSITKNVITGTYQTDTFNVKIAIPSSLGIEVDVDSQTGGGLATNILNYLTYSKSISEDRTNPANVLDVYTFAFEASSTLQGEGYLRFKYQYENYSQDSTLSASFVGVASDNTLLSQVKVSVLMPITSIEVVTECTYDEASSQYIVYQNYQTGTYGATLSFVAQPAGTSQTALVLVKPEGSGLLIYNHKGELLAFEYNEETLRYECPITSNEQLYVKGGANAVETLQCFSLAHGKEGIVKEVTFKVLEGGSGLAFVESVGDVNGLESKTVYMQQSLTGEAIVYSPGAVLSDFVYDTAHVIVSNTDTLGYFKITFKDLTVGEHIINISTINGYLVQAIVNVIEPISQVNVNLGDNASHISGVGNFAVIDNDVVNVALENGFSALLNYVTNEGAKVRRVEYGFYEPVLYGGMYDQKIKSLKNVTSETYLTDNGIGDHDFVEASSIVSTQNLNLTNLLTGVSTGVVVVRATIYGQHVENGKVSDIVVATKYICVEVYNAVKQIEASAKNISLRAENQLDAEYKYLASTTISVEALANDGLIATYDKVFIDAGLYTEVPATGEGDDIITSKFTKKVSGTSIFEAVYDYNAKTLTIKVLYVDKATAGSVHTITLLAGDFINVASGKTVFADDLNAYNVKSFVINLTIIETTVVDDISVSNLTLESETETTYNSDGSINVLGQKTYSTVYIDTSKSSSVVYKIYTQVAPINAFNKNLTFTFNPNSGYSQAMLDISAEGTVTVLSKQGGTGVIIIEPADSHSNAKIVRIPIVVADGNSWETAYEISSLSEVIDVNKHYVLTNPTTYLAPNTLLEGKTFNGGLYGKRATETSDACATIKLDGNPLFTLLGTSAQIKHLNLIGDVNSKDITIQRTNAGGTTETKTFNNGFVAYENMGIIASVKVTTYVNAYGVYVPSTLYAKTDISFVGGLVGENSGIISNCTFAGSINITNAPADVKANAISAINNGTIESCKIIVAKFASDVDANRIVVDSENTTETVYVNGVVDLRDGTRRTNSTFDDSTLSYITKQRYDGDKYVLDKNVFIRDNEGHSYGEKENAYGILFYYKALNENKQKAIAEFNTIKFEDLFDFANLAGDEAAKTEVAKQLKITALNSDGTVCNFVSVGANAIEIKGVGEFKIKITSEFDYTILFELNILSVYYTSGFSINYNGADLSSEDTLAIVHGQTREVVSSLNNKITLNGEVIDLVANDFIIAFTLIHGGSTVDNASEYITNNKLGTHTVNMLWTWNESTKVYANIDSGYGLSYNLLLNKIIGLLDTEGNAKQLFSIQLKNGTTNISTNLTDGSIEPKDTFAFEATITTDVDDDYIAVVDKTSGALKGVMVFNQTNYDCTEYFVIEVAQVSSYTYEVKVTLDLNKFYGEGSANIMDFINKKYTVVVYAFNNAGADSTRYEPFASVNFTLLPQTVSNINTTLYNVTQTTVTGVSVSERETATSVIMPSESGMFVIDMFPSYASFDYLEVVATSNTMSKLSYRLEEYDPRIVEECEDETLGWVSNYRTVTSNIDGTGKKLYEAISDKNGIRIYNNNSYNSDFYNAYADKFNEHINNINNVGKYFIKIFADSSFDADTIFTITVNAYLNGECLTAQSVFTLYMRMPEAPQLTIDGQTKVYKLVGEEIIADVLVSDDQINFTPYIARNNDDNNLSALDGKNVENKVFITWWQVSENVDIGYKRYKVSIYFAESYDYSVDSTQLKLVVETTKIFNGKSILVSSDVYIYMVDFLPEQNDISVFDAIDGVFNVTSLKKSELSLAELMLSNVNATENFINTFNSNYYFPVITEDSSNNSTGFVFGKNEYTVTVGKETYICKNKAEVLASYLSFVNGDEKTALAIYQYNAIIGDYVLVLNQDNFNRIIFSIDPATGKLYVQGGDVTGTVEMALDIQYRMPDNTIYTYEYRFSIVNSLYTTEDLPVEIANNTDFLNINNNDKAYDYILTKDLNLYDYTAITSTDKIKSLDGNNHTINIWNYAKVESGSAVFALFNQISANTTIKNLTVNLYYLSEIEVGDAITEAQVAGFAITNNGAIYNCEVIAYKSTVNTTASSVLGLKLNKDVEATVAGFVINNVGSITNSRVGAESKLVTQISYIEDIEGKVTDHKVEETTILAKPLTILASGTVSGFAVNNTGVIASSFVKNLTIQNTYYKQETRVTTGFVNSNSGTISLCYTEGGFANDNDIQASIYGLEGSGIMSGFVYLNSGKISDSYSNLMITNTRDQVGRLGAGFVFENETSGIVERCYSASKIIINNVTQMNFAGIKDFGGYNNYGTVKNSYYYITNSADQVAIESMMNTEINSVSVADDDKNFYGFSFATTKNAGTWKMTSHGPKLVSPDDIAHSVRAKYERPESVQSELNYVFVYCEGYELGTANNPIIIRNAEEFNSVLGGSTSTDIKANYGNGKIYGAYRLVNNINMLELVPEEEQQTEYKVNLLSTKLILTGEYSESSNRNGSLNGNGLTISNLAISNSSTQSDGFGLFKSVENGASIANLNITLSSGGVTADHTVFVGTLAGSLVDSFAYNISIASQDNKQSVSVIGANIVGGAFGRVVGASYLSNIYTENISVTATYNSITPKTTGYNDALILQIENIYDRKSQGFADVSLAGGIAGVVDIYTKEQYEGNIVYAEQVLDTNVQSMHVKGGLIVEGMSAGGVFGYIGEYVVAKDIALELTNDVIESKITAYNCYAGGIAAYSEGYLYQIKSEHTSTWQTAIESNYHNYYTATNYESIDRGNEKLFVSSVGYKSKATGGLVGVLNGGKVAIAYSKLNVISNSKYAGGAFGYVSIAYSKEEGSATKNALTLSEVYASGDVYSELVASYIGGVAGYFNDASATIDKINAVNYWGKNSYDMFAETNECFNVYDQTGINIGVIFNTNAEIREANVNTQEGEEGYSTKSIFSIQGVQFEGETAKKFKTNPSNSMQSYYDYQGVTTDSGAQVDLMFKQNGWYNNGNWSRQTLEALPHIEYINSSNILEIRSTADFYLFSLYGNDPDNLFVINGKERDDGSKLIDCRGWQTTYAGLRANIIGATNEDGFENLNVTLFRTANGASISNLLFKGSTAAFVNQATSCKFKNIAFTESTFATVTGGNLSGVANVVSGAGSEFDTITFDKCKIIGSAADNAGFLFATTGNEGYTDIKISNIKLNNSEENNYSVSREYSRTTLNYGLLFGSASCAVNVGSVKLYDNMSVNIVNGNKDDDTNHAVNVGLIAGYAKDLTLSLSDLTLEVEDESEGSALAEQGLVVKGPDLVTNQKYKAQATFNVGGIVGQAINLKVSANNPDVSKTSVYFAPAISVTNMQSATNLYLGTLCGIADKIELSGNALFILGQKNLGEDKVEFTSLIYDMAEGDVHEEYTETITANNSIGGVAGQIDSLTDVDSAGAGLEPFISYYGDMVAGTAKTSKTSYMNLGGLFGVAGSTESGSVLKNAFFDGTMSFGNNIVDNLRLGGIVGCIPVYNELTIYNVVASGEILLSSKDGDIALEGNRYAGGLVGFVEGHSSGKPENSGKLIIGNKDGEVIDGKTYYYKTAVITTLYTKQHYANIDAIAKIGSGATVEIGTVDGISLAQYSSTLTLCTSSRSHENGSGAVNYVTNYSYADITGNYEQGSKVVTSTVFQAVGGDSSTFTGTKLNPYILRTNGVSSKDGYALTDPFFATVDTSKKTYSLESKSSRKLYVYVENDVNFITYQFSLNNTFLFADGKSIYAGVTPINEVDDRSAVSGVIAKIYIDTNEQQYKENFQSTDSYAGFVNANRGIIYACSVQECMNQTNEMNYSTQFYGYFSNTTATATGEYTGFGGFVSYNEGYIFGSNANVYFSKDNSLPASAFVANNRETGNIAYCYASGVNYAPSGDLFTTSTPGEYSESKEDFNIWLGLDESVSDYTGYETFMSSVAKDADGYYVGDLYDFGYWANMITVTYSNGTTPVDTKAINWVVDVLKDRWQDATGAEDEVEQKEAIIEELYEQYCTSVANGTGSIKQKHNSEGELVPAFQGTYQNCYTISMAKGENVNPALPKDDGNIVYGEELASEVQLDSANDTNLYNAISGSVDSKLIELDQSLGYGYYNCDPDYNWNYPTLSGGAFKHFDFLKRCTLCVYDAENEMYEIKDKAKVSSLEISGVKLDGHTIVRDTSLDDANVNDYFKQVFYVQIPNLKVLRNLQGFIDGLDMVGDGVYTYQYSKFVVISDLNFGYEGSTLGTSHFINHLSDNSSNPVKIEIDAYNNAFRNITLKNCNLIQDIASNGQQIELRKFVFQNINLQKSNGLIGSISNNVTIKIVEFGQSTNALNEQEEILISPPNTGAQNDNVVGILVSKNNGGTISDCKLSTIIRTEGTTETKDYIIGGLVGQNMGTVINCEFSGKVIIKESTEKLNVIFGAFVGENGSADKSGTISLCLLKEGSSNIYYLSEGGSIYLSNEDERVEDDPILTALDTNGNEQPIEMKAQIYVATKGEAVVGGIAGKHTKGTINQCVTFASGENTDVQQNLGILVGDEEYQMKAFVGGIVGEVKNGLIHDSANRMNISALAVWQLTTSNPDAAQYKYKVSADGIELGIGDINDKNLAVYYEDADPTPIMKFDNKGMIYVYREMTSLAYAGGIVGYGLTTTSVDPDDEVSNVRLINYGEIMGGYRAIKPVATITATIGDTTGFGVTFWGAFAGAVAGAIVGGVNIANVIKNTATLGGIASAVGYFAAQIATEMLKAAIHTQTILKWVGIAAFGLSATLMVTMYQLAANMVTTPTFTTRGIIGNSLNYYKDVNFVQLMVNATDGYNDATVKDMIIKALNPDDSNFPADYYDLVGSNAAGAYSMFWMAATVEGGFRENKITYNAKIGEVDSYTEVVNKQLGENAHTYLALETLLEVEKPLKNYSYDGICPTLVSESGEGVYQVYSAVDNFDADKTMHAGNIENSKLAYVNVADKYKGLSAVPTQDAWGNQFDVDEDGYFVPSVGLKSEIDPDNISSIAEDGYAMYIIKNPSEWEDVVYTINKRSIDETNSDPNYKSYYLKAQIQINFVGGYKYLDVSDNSLNKFDGKITSKTAYEFNNLVLKNKGYDSFGLIKSTSGATLTNIYVKGMVTVSSVMPIADAPDTPISGGILIGKVNADAEKVEVTQSNISIGTFEFDSTALSNISHFGAIIGHVESNTSAHEVLVQNITINTQFKGATSAMIAGDTADTDSTNKAFGAVIGAVTKLDEDTHGETIIDNVELKGNIELGSNFNRVGGFVGYVGKNALVSLGNAGGNVTNMTVKAVAKANTSVGGVLGYNCGTFNIKGELTIANITTLMISADVSFLIFP